MFETYIKNQIFPKLLQKFILHNESDLKENLLAYYIHLLLILYTHYIHTIPIIVFAAIL